MLSQIILLKVYSNYPVVFHKDGYEFLPVTVTISLIKAIFDIGDYVVKTTTSNDKKPIGEKFNLRKKFMQNDGLKYLLGIKIIDPFCQNPE